MSPVEISLGLTPDRALEFATLLARDDDFRARLATAPEEVLEEFDITISSSDERPFTVNVPPKHVVEAALVNVVEASPFGQGGQHEGDRLSYWPFFIFVAT